MVDEFAIGSSPASGPRRRVRFVQISSKSNVWRITDVYIGCHWCETGRERVSEFKLVMTG